MSIKENSSCARLGMASFQMQRLEHQGVKMIRAEQDWELKPEAFLAGMGFREHLLHKSSCLIRNRPRLNDLAKVTQQISGRAGTNLIPMGYTTLFSPEAKWWVKGLGR